MTTIVNEATRLAELRTNVPEAMARMDAERRRMYHYPDWCTWDPQLHDIALFYDGSVRVPHEGPDFGENFDAGGYTHPETGLPHGVSVRPRGAALEEGADITTPAVLRQIAADALEAAEWLEANA